MPVSGGRPASSDLFGPLLISRDSNGPLVVVREQSSPALLAIRVSVPYSEPPGLIGAGRVLQLLVAERARSETERFGGRLELTRTPSHLVYSVQGPASAFNEMVAILRYLVAPPRSFFRDQRGAWLTVRREALADLETPDLLVRWRLTGELFPDLKQMYGPPDLGEPPGERGLEWFWRRWFRPEAMSVVIVGAIDAEEARAAFRDWAAPPKPEGRPPQGRGRGSAPPAEVIASRVGLGFTGGSIEPAVLAVSAALLEGALSLTGDRRVTAEFWWVGDRTALVLLGASRLDQPMSAFELRTTIQLSMAEAASRISREELSEVRRRLRQALLMRARTPGGMAAVIGEFLDRTGDPYGAEKFVASLERVELGAVRSALRTLIYRRPIVVELDP